MVIEVDKYVEQWYEQRERELVDQKLNTAWSYVLATPTNRFFDEFDQLMQGTIEERDFFIKSRKHENGELEIEDDPLGLEHVRQTDSIEDLFCDNCKQFQFSVHGFGEAVYCSSCFKDQDLGSQDQLKDFKNYSLDPGQRAQQYALVGCGEQKHSGKLPAGEKYSSTYFQKKKEFAEELCSEWLILSAKYAALDPDRVIEDYDVSIDDVPTDGWIKRVTAYLENDTEISERDEIWVLLGKDYLQAENRQGRSLRDWLDTWGPKIRYPFDNTGGIGDQNQYLDLCTEKGRALMPYRFDEFTKEQMTFSDFSSTER